MGLESIIILNTFAISIILILRRHALKFFDKSSLPDRLYLMILHVTALLLVVDILSRFDGHMAAAYRVINHIGNFAIFLLSPVLPSLWLVYVHFQVSHDEKRTRRLYGPLLIVNFAHAVILVISQLGGGWYYRIDGDNIYHRGPLFPVPALVTILLMVTAFVITIVNRRSLGKKRFFSLVFAAIPPSVGILLQIAFYGVSVMLSSVVLSLLVVFLNIQDNSMYTDYLTGVNNRKKLDAYLKEKVSSCSEAKSFSAILIDINDFKQINDTYGHVMGDSALATASKLLKSCLRSCDFVARYGGDEFCVILDIANMSDLEALVCRIHHCLDSYNRSNNHLFELKFSMGYAVYDFRSQMSAEAFLKQIDGLMYEDKQACKCKSDTI